MATGQHLTELAQGLVQRGHQVTVVTSLRAYDAPDVLFPKHEVWQGIKIYRIGSTGFGKKAKWRRAADFASFLLLCTWQLLRLPRHDAVIALTSPPLISAFGAAIARRWHAKFYYWVMDFNPDEAIAAGWLRAGSLVARILERISLFSLRNAETIVALDRFMKDRIVAKGIPSDRVAVIPPWSHDDDVAFDPAGRERFRKEHGLDGKFVVMYSGNHSPCHPLDTLLQAAEKLQQEPRTKNQEPITDNAPSLPPINRQPITNNDILFAFLGGGSEFARVKQFAAERKLTNILCLPYQPLNQLSASLSAADLHTVVMGDPFIGLVHPCKIYNILGVGTPFLYLGPAQSHIGEIISNLGTLTPSASHRHGDVDGVVQTILKMQRAKESGVPDIPSAATFYPLGEKDRMRGFMGSGPSVPSASAANCERTTTFYSKQTCLPQFLALLNPNNQ